MSAKFLALRYNRRPQANWLLVQKDGGRIVVLENGDGLRVRSTRHLQLIEVSDPSEKDWQKAIQMEAVEYSDLLCPMAPLNKQQACREGFGAQVEAVHKVAKFFLGLTKGKRVFALFGRHAGIGKVRAYAGKAVVAELPINVEPTIEIPVALHIVLHLKGGSGNPVQHAPNMTKARLLDALATANGILSQAGIRFEPDPVGFVTVARDLGKVVMAKNADAPDVREIRDKPAAHRKINVFLLGEIQNNNKTSGVAFEKRDIFIDDREPLLGELLAHELGHVLDLGHVVGEKKVKNPTAVTIGNVTQHKTHERDFSLMAPGDGGESLSYGEIMNLMRPKAKKLASR